MDYLLIERADGGVSVITLRGLDSAKELDLWVSTAKQEWLPVASSQVVEDPVFPDEHFREAWVKNGAEIDVPLARAKAFTKARIRWERAPVLSHLDGVYQRAQDQGDTVKAAAVRTERQRLRDLPAEVDNKTTLAELKAMKAETSIT